ncbi:MAG: hypothetical protein J6O89_02330 [Aeriscardovia sp.]|nr:hypothetical protein [Aeriscardovia sp.]
MRSYHRNNVLKKHVRYFLLFFSVAACVLSLGLIFGLKSYASPSVFNPDVELEALNSNGTVDTNPSFKVTQTYHMQLSAILPTAQDVENEGKAFAMGAQVAGGVESTALGMLGTWAVNQQYAPTLAGINLSEQYNATSNNSVGVEENIITQAIGGISTSGLNSATNVWSGAGEGWTLTFNSSAISFLEQYGHKAATAQTPTASATGLQPGDRFGITFYIKISSSTQSSKNKLTAYSGFAGSATQNPSSWSSLSTSSINMAPPETKNEGDLNVELGQIKEGLFEKDQALSAPQGSSLDFQATSSLPDPSSMTDQSSYFAFKLLPSLGLNLTNLQSAKVAGIPLSSLDAGWKEETSSGSDSTVEGGRFAYWVLELSAADILQIEKDGFAPASSSQPQASTPGIKVGSPFALTFSGQLSSNPPQTSYLRAITGLKSQTAWSRVSPSPAQIAISLEGSAEEQPQEEMEINLLNSDGLVETSSPYYYSTKLETTSDSSTMLNSSTGKFRFQVVITLPNPADMKGNESALVIKNIPGQGLALPNPEYILTNISASYSQNGQFSIAGQPIGSDKLKPTFKTSCENTVAMIEGSQEGSSYWELVLTPLEIEEIEQYGSGPATPSSPQGASGLQPGDKFAIVFNGFVTNKASGVVTDQLQLSWASQSSSDLEEESQQVISTQSVSLYPQTLTVAPAANLNVLDQGYINQNPYTGLQTPITYQLEAALPNPSQMTGKYSTFSLTDAPRSGVSVENPEESPSDFEIAGLPLLSVPGIKVSSSSTNEWLEGNEAKSQSFTVELSASSVEYLEKYGYSPATRSAQASKTPAINPGSLFALTFSGELNSSAPLQHSNCFNTAYSFYKGNEDGQSYEEKSTLASVGVKYNGISTSLSAQLNVVNQSTGLLERNPVYAPGEPIEFQLTLTLPDPASLINTSAAAQSLTIPGWYGVQVSPGEGMEVETFLSNSTYVAGMEYQGNSTLQGDSTVFGGLSPQQQEDNQQYISGSSSNSPTIPSKDSTYWGMAFNSAGVKYIEENGEAAATFSSKAYKPVGGLKPGDKFAITFYGELSSGVTGASNALYGFAGYQSNFPQDPGMSSGWWILCNGQGASTVNYLPTNELWKYERGSYKSATLYVSALQVPSPVSTIQVIQNGKVQENPSYPQGNPIDFQVSSTLPSSENMVGNYSYLRIEITPESGISLYNGALASNSQYLTVGGSPLSSVPGVKILSSSSSASIENPESVSIIFSPSSISYLVSKGLAQAGSVEIDAVGYLNQNASQTPKSNNIEATSFLAPSVSGDFSLQSEQSEISVQEEEEISIKNLPFTGDKYISMFMLSVFSVLLFAAGVGAWEINKKFRRE